MANRHKHASICLFVCLSVCLSPVNHDTVDAPLVTVMAAATT